MRSPSPSRAISPLRIFFDRLIVSISVRSIHSHRSRPILHLAVARSFSRDVMLHAHRKHTDTEMEEALPSSRSDISCNLHVHACRDFAPDVSTAHISSLSTCFRTNFTCIFNSAFIHRTFRECRVYFRTQLFIDPSCSGSSMCVKSLGKEGAQCVISVAPFVIHPLSFARGVTLSRITELF